METITLRPVTVGDLRELAPALQALEGFLTAQADARPGLLPELVRALAPCLCRLSGLTPAALDALPLPEFLSLIGALGEALRPPFSEGTR
jgi:hypothetical protein